ncbi:exodeoxyribonuclease VII small subunit [Granulicatella elegans]|jgi:exodeoxyribonuclease VII, small subunit|uniref:Exodeoxyribonuclease 7 small subunit n=1 Tax=Granulicatella elegans ATCC 700633 TaxID=626369 RepID=D0BJZ0_9LACT|nr:exodeoxyribonuclease VII small subunit [Granulicatella elegans]EEW93393.1 exodeoxyribonuclease VII, small subunit [Granulicatella elegans ATCC 700633]MBF0993411.1 exodeoxyribonuclease VII small subunit [Granulicatella sp.]RKW26917.1 MAG: exodeoxyribonuclease VII small subunit [Granulicatella sp.]
MVKKEKKFEEAMSELEQIVQQLERGDVPLDEAIAKFQEGMALSQYCNETLTKAEETVSKMIVVKED